MRKSGAALAVSAIVGLMVAGTGLATAQQSRGHADGAAVTLSKSVVQAGQRVLVTLSGWRTRNVTLSVCGNLARRGSGDCNLAASQALKLVDAPAPTVTELTVFEPPGTCPCVIRASSAAQDEVAFAPIEILGVAVGPVVGPDFESLLDVSVQARVASSGAIAAVRAALGGPTDYVVSLSVSNKTAETLSAIALAGSVGRGRKDTVVSFDIPPPGPLDPGATWAHQLRVTVPAPVVKRFVWRIVASGAGQSVTAEAVVTRAPLGFVVLVTILVVDLAAMAYYFAARRIGRRRRQPAVSRPATHPDTDVPGGVTVAPSGHHLPFPVGVLPSGSHGGGT